jgi:hypothetical protein
MGLAVLLLLVLLVVVALRYGASPRARRIARQALGWAFGVGAVGFALGFVGPIIFTPEANQGPLLGIFITGPLSFLAGFAWGAVRAWRAETRPGGDYATGGR